MKLSGVSVLTVVALLVLAFELALAFWPVPGKYPWTLPMVMAAAGAGMALLGRKNDVACYGLGLATVAGLAAWTVKSLGDLGVEVAFLLAAGMLGLPMGMVVLAMGRSGRADPYGD
ncbi:hypothetical protein KRR26_03455 [Corallococcus sp. M34]|uniref:hypothetical protein n=1 Tax=Citreicoccus inhibens TaxID=2849499 RepID=UPI0011C3641F|nr:hypothetical protein [Citreicoccus inhibens]MBU8894641.1 hypothetical protein [Citreicoccus inhibens]